MCVTLLCLFGLNLCSYFFGRRLREVVPEPPRTMPRRNDLCETVESFSPTATLNKQSPRKEKKNNPNYYDQSHQHQQHPAPTPTRTPTTVGTACITCCLQTKGDAAVGTASITPEQPQDTAPIAVVRGVETNIIDDERDAEQQQQAASSSSAPTSATESSSTSNGNPFASFAFGGNVALPAPLPKREGGKGGDSIDDDDGGAVLEVKRKVVSLKRARHQQSPFKG